MVKHKNSANKTVLTNIKAHSSENKYKLFS